MLRQQEILAPISGTLADKSTGGGGHLGGLGREELSSLGLENRDELVRAHVGVVFRLLLGSQFSLVALRRQLLVMTSPPSCRWVDGRCAVEPLRLVEASQSGPGVLVSPIAW